MEQILAGWKLQEDHKESLTVFLNLPVCWPVLTMSPATPVIPLKGKKGKEVNVEKFKFTCSQ